MKCIVELFGNDRNGRKMIAWGKRIGCADAGHVFDAERRKVVQTFRPRFHSPRRFAILVSAMLRQSFIDFIFATNTDGSGKAASYVRALDMLGPILTKHYPVPVVKEIKDHYTDASAKVLLPRPRRTDHVFANQVSAVTVVA